MILASWEDCREFRKLAICGQAKAVPGAASAPEPPNRPPKSLGLGIWTAQIAKYEAAYTPQRLFPAKLLLGAETVLARLLWEADTKMYTPLKLGEIMQARHFTSTGVINQVAVKNTEKTHKKFALTQEGTFEEIEPSKFSPGSVLTMRDALQAIQWAFVFCEYADEPTAGKWVEYWIKTARNKSNFEAVKSMYEIASWRLAT